VLITARVGSSKLPVTLCRSRAGQAALHVAALALVEPIWSSLVLLEWHEVAGSMPVVRLLVVVPNQFSAKRSGPASSDLTDAFRNSCSDRR